MKKIKVIKKLETDVLTNVYDIEVNDEHHYILENGIVSHNSGWIYGSSIVIAMRKLKLKEDEDGNKTTDVKGIRAYCKCMKTRYNKPFEEVVLQIPYETGLDPYSGLIAMFIKKGLLVKDGRMLRYTGLDGKSEKHFEKNISDTLLDKIMLEFSEQIAKATPIEEIEGSTDDDVGDDIETVEDV